MEIDLYTTLEIVNEMWERGFKFVANSISTVVRQQSSSSMGYLIPPFVAMDGLGENVAKQLVRAREEVSSLRQNCASVADYHRPWLKRWMKWDSR